MASRPIPGGSCCRPLHVKCRAVLRAASIAAPDHFDAMVPITGLLDSVYARLACFVGIAEHLL